MRLLQRRKEVRRCSMKKVRPVVARDARELAKVLGLSPADGMEIEFRSDLNDKIIEVVGKKGLTHSDVARLAHTSRTRVTAILNRNTHDISTDLMLRVLGSLGVQAKLQGVVSQLIAEFLLQLPDDVSYVISKSPADAAAH